MKVGLINSKIALSKSLLIKSNAGTTNNYNRNGYNGVYVVINHKFYLGFKLKRQSKLKNRSNLTVR